MQIWDQKKKSCLATLRYIGGIWEHRESMLNTMMVSKNILPNKCYFNLGRTILYYSDHALVITNHFLQLSKFYVLVRNYQIIFGIMIFQAKTPYTLCKDIEKFHWNKELY